jgi:serine/threonine-protein kinase RsbT
MDADKAREARVLFHGCRQVDPAVGISGARALCRQAIRASGLEKETLKAELLTIVDELGHNILKYGRSGYICITVYLSSRGHLFRILAEDRGQGIRDLEKALEPGFSTGGGLGRGLNLLQALSDDVRIASLLDGGTRVEVWKAVP